MPSQNLGAEGAHRVDAGQGHCRQQGQSGQQKEETLDPRHRSHGQFQLHCDDQQTGDGQKPCSRQFHDMSIAAHRDAHSDEGDAKDNTRNGQTSAEMAQSFGGKPGEDRQREAGKMEVSAGQQHDRLAEVHRISAPARGRHPGAADRQEHQTGARRNAGRRTPSPADEAGQSKQGDEAGKEEPRKHQRGGLGARIEGERNEEQRGTRQVHPRQVGTQSGAAHQLGQVVEERHAERHHDQRSEEEQDRSPVGTQNRQPDDPEDNTERRTP